MKQMMLEWWKDQGDNKGKREGERAWTKSRAGSIEKKNETIGRAARTKHMKKEKRDERL
jgi:hypothetical protein